VDARRLLGDHLAAEMMFAHQTIGAGEIEDQFGSLDGKLGRRRQRRPEVLAYLYTKGIIAGSEKEIRSERHFPTPYLYFRNTRRNASGCELARGTTDPLPRGEPGLVRVSLEGSFSGRVEVGALSARRK
jgi:hypothetical protein